MVVCAVVVFFVRLSVSLPSFLFCPSVACSRALLRVVAAEETAAFVLVADAEVAAFISVPEVLIVVLVARALVLVLVLVLVFVLVMVLVFVLVLEFLLLPVFVIVVSTRDEDESDTWCCASALDLALVFGCDVEILLRPLVIVVEEEALGLLTSSADF